MASVCMERMKQISIRDLAGMGQQFAQPHAGLAVLREFEDGGRGGELRLESGHAGQALPLADRIRQVGAARSFQVGLVVEQVQLRGRAVLEEIDDALGLGREVRQAGRLTLGTGVGWRAARPAPQRRFRCWRD